jgi:glycogen(starch) synthase
MSKASKYRVLMFGWEFAPLIAGGLGVVCKAITTSLVDTYNTEVTYVLPKIPEQIGLSYHGVHFRSAGLDKLSNLNIHEIESSLASAYIAPEHYDLLNFLKEIDVANPALAKITGREIYGKNLLLEVERYAVQAEKISRQEDFDVIHNHDWMTADAAIAAKEASGKPMVMHIHATEYERTLGHPNPAIFAKELAGMQAADKIIAVSQTTKDRIVANYGIDAGKIVVVHNALERVEGKFGPIAKSIYKDDKVVLFLARLTAMKGANYLLEAAAHVLKHMPKTKFLFVGAGELLESLIEQSVDLGIANKVTFTGFLAHDQVDQVYRRADVFIMPSVAEPFGITPLEAIKNGTPVILSKQSGASEVLQNVLKVDFWDTQELANKIIAVLKHGVLAEELTNNSKRDLEQLSWDDQTKKILDVYSQLKQNLKLNS